MTESKIQSKILRYLDYLGAWTVKTIDTNKRGTPDVLCCLAGQFIAFEVKQPGKKPTKIQEYQIKKIRASGGIVEVVCSVEEVKNIINKYFEITL